MSIAFPGQYCIVRFAIIGPGFLCVMLFLRMHLPGSLRADGLFLSNKSNSSLLGFIAGVELEYIDP